MIHQQRSKFILHFFAKPVAVLVAVFASTVILAEPFSGTCPNGAQVQQERYCAFFKRFNIDPTTVLDTQIADTLGVKNSNETRSIGLIISIAKYPSMPGHDISAAAVDGERLSDFLINNQKFDEVIVLRDDEATTETINYFLEEYLVNRAIEFNRKARLLIAYSGHGTSDTPTTQASFILGAANSPTDSAHSYKMKNFSIDVQKLADLYFHVLTLINACYGGSFFTNSLPGGNPSAPEFPGSYSITAGSAKDETRSLDAKRGSLFFDLLIGGVTKGIADNSYWEFSQVDEGGNTTSLNGLTRTEPLSTFLTTAYGSINKSLSRTNKNFQKLSKPWIGPAQNGVAEGAFFFVSKKGIETPLAVLDPYIHMMLASNDSSTTNASFGFEHTYNADSLKQNEATVAMLQSVHRIRVREKDGTRKADHPAVYDAKEAGAATATSNITSSGEIFPIPPLELSSQSTQITTLPPGPISSIRGRPEIKIFKPPHVYPVQGYDFSSADRDINWKKMNDTSRPRFIYARAVGWKGPDKTFSNRWSQAKALGIDYGAYLKFDFCLPPAEQISRLLKIVPLDFDALPLAVEIVNPTGEKDIHQLTCFNSKEIEEVKAAILKLASDIRTQYGKTPLLYGNRNNLSTFLDQRSDEFMIWLGSYGASGIKLSGRNPWTLWQYSGTLNIKGVGPKTTGEVFFGTEDQYELFKKGEGNVALKAVN